MASISGTNVQVAENQRTVAATRACADSGLEVVRYWMSQVVLSGSTPVEQRFASVGASLEDVVANIGMTGLTPVCTATTISFSDVALSAAQGETFSAVLTKIDDDNMQLDVTGRHGSFARTIRTNYLFAPQASPIFDYGVASRGPVSMQGNVGLEGLTSDDEATTYIESLGSIIALSITGNSHIAGDVKIVNPLASVDLKGGKAGIGGATGSDATLEPFTTIGVPAAEFPVMEPTVFATYATTSLDPNLATSAHAVLENIIVPPNTNPTFSGHATIRGIVYIETPNIVTFTGQSDVTGIIVGNGDPTDDSATNSISFRGNVNSWPVGDLPSDPQFDGIRDEVGTFVIAPGFHVSFGGHFEGMSGAVAANGIEFFGKAGGTVNGSLINYSENPMTFRGNTDVYFDRSGQTQVPAGFVPEIVLQYDGSTYCEII